MGKKAERKLQAAKDAFVQAVAPEPVSPYENVYGDKPEKHAVVATMTQDEMKVLGKLHDTLRAMDRATEGVTIESALKVQDEYAKAWEHVFKVYNLNPVWPMQFCTYSGKVYISE